MENNEEFNEMQELVKEVNKHCYNYYVLDNPTISDKEYDKLYDKLVQLEANTGIILPDSPTQRVGGETLDKFKKYPHKFKLYSLDKCQTKQELEKWVNDIKEKQPNATFTCEYKFDGLSLVCKYKNGLFVSAGTRGKGTIGEDVSEQAKTIKTVPLAIKFKGELIVQGESMITLTNLSEFNKNSTEQLKNARNAAAGAIRNLDPKETAKRNLDWFAYTVHYAEGKDFTTQAEMMNFLKENGFNTGTYFEICNNFEEISKQIDIIEQRKKIEDILLDGVVVRLNEIQSREQFGFTAKFPKWAMAYKFEAEEVSSLLKNIIWQVGRTGKITPIAEVEPVELAGATIKRATLNNLNDIKKKKVEINSRVFIRRSNEVIPEIVGLAERLPNSVPIEVPIVCPCCGTKLVEIGANLFCPNVDGCRDQIIDRLTNFASKFGFDIEGLSISSISSLYDKFRIKYFYEIFELSGQEFMLMGNFKEQKAQKIVQAIQKSKDIPFSKFIYALGIGGVGVKTAKDIAERFETFDMLKNAEYEEIAEIFNIGDVIAQNIFNYFKNEHNLFQIQKLFEYGIKILKEDKKMENTFFSNKTVVLTGTIDKYTREQLLEILEKFGANASNSVSKKTDYVIAGKNAGSKLTDAQNLNIKIINEIEFEQIMQSELTKI